MFSNRYQPHKNSLKYSPKLIHKVLEDSDVSIADHNKSSKCVGVSGLTDTDFRDQYDQLFTQNISLYKKIDAFKAIMKQTTINIRKFTQIFVKDLMMIQNLNNVTEGIVEDYLVRILKVCEKIDEINTSSVTSNNQKCEQKKDKYIGDFCKKESPIYIDDLQPDQQSDPNIGPNQSKNISRKSLRKQIELSDLIQQQEQYSSVDSRIPQHSKPNQDIIPLSSVPQRKTHSITNVIDHFYDKMTNSSASNSSNIPSRLTSLRDRSCEDDHITSQDSKYMVSINKERLSDVKEESDHNNNSSGTFNDSCSEQSLIEVEEEVVPTVSAFESRMPHRQYSNRNHSLSQIWDNSNSNFHLPAQSNCKTNKKTLKIHDDNKQNFHVQTYDYQTQKNSCKQSNSKYIYSQVLSRRKIFNP